MIRIEKYRGNGVAAQQVEIVERKGTGHPDTICDSVMEAISVALSAVYQREFGVILHHNIDKGLLAAGRVAKHFGGGEVLKPMELIIGDRATFEASGRTVPVADIAIAAAKQWIGEHLRLVDPERHLVYRVVLAPGSAELADIFARPGAVREANDTSAAIGYWPLTSTERAVLGLERYLNSPDFKGRYPETGEDVKIMGLRTGRSLDFTVAMPLLAGSIGGEGEYFARKAIILEEMRAFAAEFSGFSRAVIHYNALDLPGRGLGGVYLSLLGTSAEDADSGQVGRGNRVNGLISVNRPLGTEAAAGKNPVSHVGKIYNVLAHRIARLIYERVEGVREVYVLLLSRIGSPVDAPLVANLQLGLKRGVRLVEVAGGAEEVCGGELARLGEFCRELSRGVYPVC
jgi:S-adenosylmethionine synthetase